MKLNITSQQVKDLNKEIVKITGEPHGIVKDYIDTAIFSSEYYDNYFDKVAAVVRSLTMNHNFEQGNKRTAVIVLSILMPQVDFSDDFLVDLVLSIVNDKLEVEDISKQLALYSQDRITEVYQGSFIDKHQGALKVLYSL